MAIFVVQSSFLDKKGSEIEQEIITELLTQNSFVELAKFTREIIPASKHKQRINYKHDVLLSENAFLTVLFNAIWEFVPNGINTIKKDSW